MPRYKLTIEYDGGPYVGWQRQETGPSVQAALEIAVAAFCGQSVTLYGAGRTDAGVHACGQVAHIDLARPWRADTVRDAINAHLRDQPVAVLSAEAVPDSFDARFSATSRRYQYRIINRRAPLALEAGHAWHVRPPLDAAAMHTAAQTLLGWHDFTTFRASRCQAKSPMKTLDRLAVTRCGERILVDAQARSFLHHQVRSMVGSLVEVGSGRWQAETLRAALEARDRTACGPVAPADGLYFMAVQY